MKVITFEVSSNKYTLTVKSPAIVGDVGKSGARVVDSRNEIILEMTVPDNFLSYVSEKIGEADPLNLLAEAAEATAKKNIGLNPPRLR
jgi:hypothetical protein